MPAFHLAENSPSDETNETIDDITRKNSGDTPTSSNANHQFPTSQNLQRPGWDAPLRVALYLRLPFRSPFRKPHEHVTRTECSSSNASPRHREGPSELARGPRGPMVRWVLIDVQPCSCPARRHRHHCCALHAADAADPARRVGR